MDKIQIMSRQKPNFKKQYLATLVVNIPIVGACISNGWSSAANVLLLSDDTPLPSKISMDEASWIASLIYIGGLIGTFFFGFVTKRCGRKWLLISISTLSIIPWLLIYFAQNVYYLYASRIINGFFGGGVNVIVPIFLVEIASDSVRGTVVSSTGVSTCIGMLVGFSLGTFNFYVTPVAAIGISILFAILFVFFPETPSFLQQQNKITEMENSMEFYQNVDPCSKSLMSNTEIDKNQNSLKWSDIKLNPGRKAMIISIFLTLLAGFSGVSSILNYSSTVFKKTGSTVSANTSTLITAILLVIGSLTANFLVDRAGRKILYVLSSIGVALGFITLGLFMMLKSWNYSIDELNWIPMVSLPFSTFVSSLAVITMPIGFAAEILPKKIKELGVSVCMILTYLSIFAITKLLPLLMDELKLYGCMFLFASVCLFSGFCIILYVPETKGKSHEEIMQSLK